jgi:hypothetical protein
VGGPKQGCALCRDDAQATAGMQAQGEATALPNGSGSPMRGFPVVTLGSPTGAHWRPLAAHRPSAAFTGFSQALATATGPPGPPISPDSRPTVRSPRAQIGCAEPSLGSGWPSAGPAAGRFDGPCRNADEGTRELANSGESSREHWRMHAKGAAGSGQPPAPLLGMLPPTANFPG